MPTIFSKKTKCSQGGVVGEVVVGEVPPQPQYNPLEIQVDQEEAPGSPSLSPGSPSPVFQPPLGDASSFKGFHTLDDLEDLAQWANHTRDLQTPARFQVEAPENSKNLKVVTKMCGGVAVGVQTPSPLRRCPSRAAQGLPKGLGAPDIVHLGLDSCRETDAAGVARRVRRFLESVELPGSSVGRRGSSNRRPSFVLSCSRLCGKIWGGTRQKNFFTKAAI